MNAREAIVPLLQAFVPCFTAPGFLHFQHFGLAHTAWLGVPHCVTETLRLTPLHPIRHWTTPSVLLRTGRWSCRQVSQALLDRLIRLLRLPEELILPLDDTRVKKWGKKFFGLGFYPDLTDKHPGASKRRVLGPCWVVLALLGEYAAGQWVGFPRGALLFVPLAACPEGWRFQTQIEWAVLLLQQLRWPAKRLIGVVDNLYAKAQLASRALDQVRCGLVSRLRSNAAL